jgi:hypothetical protein
MSHSSSATHGLNLKVFFTLISDIGYWQLASMGKEGLLKWHYTCKCRNVGRLVNWMIRDDDDDAKDDDIIDELGPRRVEGGGGAFFDELPPPDQSYTPTYYDTATCKPSSRAAASAALRRHTIYQSATRATMMAALGDTWTVHAATDPRFYESLQPRNCRWLRRMIYFTRWQLDGALRLAKSAVITDYDTDTSIVALKNHY